MANSGVNEIGPGESFISNKCSQLEAAVKGTGLTSKHFGRAGSYQKKKSSNDISENLERSGSGNHLLPWLAHGGECNNELELASQ